MQKKRGLKKKMVFVLAIIAIFLISLGAFTQEASEDTVLSSEPLISLPMALNILAKADVPAPSMPII